MINKIDFNSVEDWKTYRNSSIGGSDLGTLLGVNQYKTISELVADKKGLSNELETSEFAGMGQLMEPVIFDKFVKTEFPEAKPITSDTPYVFTNAKFPRMHATLDGIIDKEAIIEIKFVSFFGHQKWLNADGNLEVPIEYKLQVKLYMEIMELDKAYVFAFFQKTCKCEKFLITKDEVPVDLNSVVSNFWTSDYNMIPAVPASKVEPITEELLRDVKEAMVLSKKADMMRMNAEDKILTKYAEGTKLKWNNLSGSVSIVTLKNGRVKKLKVD